MATDPALSILNNQGLLPNWDSFLRSNDNDFESNPITTTGSSTPTLHCKVRRLWNLEFDSDAKTTQFPAQRAQSSGSLLLPLASSSVSTSLPPLPQILDLFGVSQNQQIPGDQGVLDQDQAGASSNPSNSLVADIVHSFDPNQLFQIEADGRNAVWLTPGQILRSDVALTLGIGPGHDPILTGILTTVAQYFDVSLPGITSSVSGFEILLQRTCFGVQTQQSDGTSSWNISRTFQLTFRIGFNPFIFWVTLEPTGLSFTITQQSADPGKLLSLIPFGSTIQAVESGILSHLEVLQLAAGKGTDPNAQVWWRVILGLKLNSNTAPAVYFEYDSVASTFTGGLILGELKDDDGTILLRGFYATDDDKLLPSYDAGKAILPVAGDTPLPYKQLVLSDIWSGFSSIPAEFPTAIALANIVVQETSAAPLLWFSAKLIQPPQNPASTSIPIPFTWDLMDLYMKFNGTTPEELSLSTHFTLQDSPPSDRIAELSLSLKFDQGVWTINGHVQDLRLSMLWQFFDKGARNALLNTLGKIEVTTLDVTYTYESQAVSKLAISGKIDIGGLEVKILYQYDSTGWEFQFVGGASHGDATLGDILDSIVDGASGALPKFIDGIKIPVAGEDNSPIAITVEKKESRLLFAFRVSIDRFSFSLVQLGPQDGSAPTKRLLRFAVNKIPIIPNVPLLNLLPQPFDALEYMWVDDPGTSGGWTTTEIKAINEILEPSDQVHFKPRHDNNGVPVSGQSDVVVQAGHHFLVLNKGDPVLDHVFFASKSPPPAGPENPPDDSGGVAQFARTFTSRRRIQRRRFAERAAADPGSDPPPNSAPTKGALSFSYGPLSVTAITLQFKEQGKQQILSLTMDATFNLDPITFSLLGFGIGLDLSGLTLDNLNSVLGHLEVELSGLSLSFNKPPLLIAGGFEHDKQDNADIYMGGVGVSFPPYTFVGLGEYAVLDGFKSVFLYAKLDGPLVTLGFATISGVRLGLGYNSAVRTPKLEEITQFPFVNDHAVAGTGNDPMKILKAMVQGNAGGQAWVTPTNDSYWFAAGLTLIAFDILTVTAVAMVQFREAGLIISVIADAIAQMPPSVTSRSEMIVYVEIGFIAELNTIDGYFRVEAALAPTSFLLVPQCKIYGGMALVYWFSPNAHAGDWVFTIGGYHRKFQVPEWYPAVHRLGISFDLGILSITGETYFAITPKVAMGGALIHVTLTIGPIQAWLDAGFDALVQFHPLHYLVDFHVAVGVSFNADVWFVHIHISATVGAWLEVQGPEFGGTAHVDFCMFAFDVDFGASPRAPDPMNLLQFWEMLHKPGPNVQSQNQNDTQPVLSFLSFDANVNDSQGPVNSHEDGAALKFALEDGNFPMPTQKASAANDNSNPTSTGAGSKWFVKGGTFKFRVSTDFAISQASVVGNDSSSDPHDHTIVISAPDTAKIYSRPMHVSSPIKSEVSIKIIKVTSLETVVSGWRNVAPDMKLMPLAAFGAYDPDIDPSNPKAVNLSQLLDGKDATVSLIMGVMISSPPPKLDESPVAVANATAMMSFRILDFRRDPNHGDQWLIPAFEPPQTKYLPAPLTAPEEAGSNQQRWDAMRTTWSGLTSKDDLVNDQTDGILAMCNGIFAWQTNRPQAEVAATTTSDGTTIPAPGTPAPPPTPAPAPGPQDPTSSYQPWRLTGSLPKRLINSLEAAYLDLPRVAVV